MKNKREIDNNCEKATFLIEKKQFVTISPEDAAELIIHLNGCQECRIFQQQSEVINNACRLILSKSTYPPLHLDSNFKEALQVCIDKAINQ